MLKRLAIFIPLSFGGIQAASAGDIASGVPRDPASEATDRPASALQITPYMWATGLNGSISPFREGPTLDVDKSFSDVLHDLDFGGFVNVWGRYDRFVFSGDLMYVDTSDSHASGPLPAFQIPGLGVTIPPGASVTGKVDSKQFMTTLQGGYRVIDGPDFTLDALAGARFWYISNDVTVTASHFAIGTRTASHGESFGWIDPVVGLRAFAPMTENFSVQAQADVGGFGVGSSVTWSVLATANYAFTQNFSVSAGYKALKVDYDHGGHVYDALLKGPVVGMTWRF